MRRILKAVRLEPEDDLGDVGDVRGDGEEAARARKPPSTLRLSNFLYFFIELFIHEATFSTTNL